MRDFYARFKAQNNVVARKTIPPPNNQVLCLSKADVKRTLCRVNPQKSVGPDIPVRVLRECAEQLVDVFTDIFIWSLNTSSISKKAQQRLYFLRRLRKAHLPPPILTMFYRGTIESVPSSCITAWFGNCAISDCKTLQRIVRTAEKIIGVSPLYHGHLHHTLHPQSKQHWESNSKHWTKMALVRSAAITTTLTSFALFLFFKLTSSNSKPVNSYTNEYISILLANVQSLENKLDDLRAKVKFQRDIRDCSLLCFTETWLNPVVLDLAIQPAEFFSVHRMDRTQESGKSRGGVVCLMEVLAQREVVRWTDQSVAALQDTLDDADWDMFWCSSDDINVFTEAVVGFIGKLADDNVKKTIIRTFPNKKPWVDKTIHDALRSHAAVYSTGLASGDMVDCMATTNSTTIIKFADDTVVVRLISDNNETAYLEEIRNLENWCQRNNLLLNV
ncbi:hypothetical protein QTP70_003344, partial [Hemibagrus guttatus]